MEVVAIWMEPLLTISSLYRVLVLHLKRTSAVRSFDEQRQPKEKISVVFPTRGRERGVRGSLSSSLETKWSISRQVGREWELERVPFNPVL